MSLYKECKHDVPCKWRFGPDHGPRKYLNNACYYWEDRWKHCPDERTSKLEKNGITEEEVYESQRALKEAAFYN